MKTRCCERRKSEMTGSRRRRMARRGKRKFARNLSRE
jgi:hypothetical protein